MIFTYNHIAIASGGAGGGAIVLVSATLIVDSEANLTFSHNSAANDGGALLLVNLTAHMNASGIEFINNSIIWRSNIFYIWNHNY